MNPDPADEWVHALQSAWSLAKAERYAEMKGRRPRLLDDRGLHPFSLEVGRIIALQRVCPALREADFNHIELRAEARREGEIEFLEEWKREAEG